MMKQVNVKYEPKGPLDIMKLQMENQIHFCMKFN